MRISGRVRLSDLRSISQGEFSLASQVCAKIRNCREARPAYIREHKLDPDVALPAGAWTEGIGNVTHDLYRLVSTPKYNIINRLRLYTQDFTGYQLASLQDSCGQKGFLTEVPDDFDVKIVKIAPELDYWLYKYFFITSYLPEQIIVRPPRILGEIGWNVDGSPVNRDTYSLQERLNLLYEAGIIDWLCEKTKTAGESGVNVLEIGAGYGGLAYHLKRIVPEMNYYICDIPESLLFSSLYLAIAYPECPHTIYEGIEQSQLCKNDLGFKFIANFMFRDLLKANIRIDLAINTLSFSEMSEKQVRYYAENLSSMLGDTGVLFEQNCDMRPVGLIDCKSYLPEYLKFRKRIKSKSIPQLEFGEADQWANKPVPRFPSPRVRNWIFTRLGFRWFVKGKDYRIIRRLRQNRVVSWAISRSPRLATFLAYVVRKLLVMSPDDLW